MEMITKQSNRMRRGFFAVAIFFGMNAALCSAQSAVDDAANANEIYADDEIITNTDYFSGVQAGAYGLHVIGSKNLITQSGGIFLTGNGAIGVRIDGSDNRFVIPHGTLIRVIGTGGKGVLICGGQGNRLTIAGNVFAAGNAVEFASNTFNPAQVDEFTLTGTISGQNAIYIAQNVAVDEINIDDGAQIFGSVVSKSSSATNLKINTDLTFNDAIDGAFNVKVNGGTLKFFGTAKIDGVNVAKGAKLFGNTFTAENFINSGTIGAASPDTNLIINGNLVSNGTLQKVSGGSAGMIIVNGAANVEGSTVTTDSLLPNETATVLIADSVTGNIANPEDKPVPISAMLNATGKIVGNTLTVTTHEADNLHELNSREAETFSAMRSMYENLDEDRQNEMREFYNLEPAAAKDTLTQIGSNDSAQIMSVAQQNTAVDRFISTRINEIFAPDYIDIAVHPMNFAEDDENSAVTVQVKVPRQPEENFWLNYMKNWGSLRGNTDYHGSVIVGGYDKPFGEKWRAGIFATYGTIGYGADSSRATVYDTRLGLYAGWHNRASDVYFYVNGGQLRNSLHRSLSSLGLSTNANYKSRIIEIGGEYKYDLQPRRTWHISPFVNFQASHLKQNGYDEHGAGIYNQHTDGSSNTYFAAQIGLDLKRYYRKGMVGMRFGVKHGFTGADPDLRFSYEGDGSRNYHLRQERDKTHFVCSLRGENEFARGWFIGGETELQLGEDDRDVTASLTLRRMW